MSSSGDQNQSNSLSDSFVELFNFNVSNTSLYEESLVQKVGRGLTCGKKLVHMNSYLQKLEKLCLKYESDNHKLHLKRKKALRVIKEVCMKIKFHKFTEHEVIRLLWWIIAWSRKRDLLNCVKTYHRLLKFIPRGFDDIIIYGANIFCLEGKLWKLESFCETVYSGLLIATDKINSIIGELIRAFQTLSVDYSYDAVPVSRNIYTLLKLKTHCNISSKCIKKFMSVLIPATGSPQFDLDNYRPALYTLILCLQMIIDKVKITDPGKVIEIVYFFLNELFHKRITSEVFIELSDEILKDVFFQCLLDSEKVRQIVFQLLESKDLNTIRCLTSILIIGIDTAENRQVFKTPRIFFFNGNYDIKIKKKNKQFRKIMFSVLTNIRQGVLSCVMTYSEYREILERIYCLLCILLCESPGGFTVTSVTCLAFGIQKYALENQETLSFECTCHLHAMVSGLLSFIGYVTKVEQFYTYVNRIITLRAKFAKHMNPPFKLTYEHANYEILCNPNEFLFNKWDLRFGLWIGFRIKGKKIDSTVIPLNKDFL